MIGIRDTRRRRLSARLAGQRTRGQAFVELALVAPVLLMLVLAGIDLGRLFYAQIAVTNAAREGAMVAAENPSSYSAGNGCDSVTNAVMCAVLNEGQGFVSVTPADVAMSCTPGCAKAYGNKVTVTVTGHFTVLTPIIWAFTGGQDVTFERVATADIVVIPAFVGATPSPVPTVTPDPSTSPEPTATPEPTPTPVPCAPPFVDFNHSQQNKNRPVDFTSIATPTSGACLITFYRWDYGDGQTDAGGTLNSVSHDYGSANQGATFTVTLTVTTPSGTYSASKPVTTKS